MTQKARPVGSFCWNELGTTDPAAAKAFYTGLFGWSAEDRPMPGDMGTYTMFRLSDKDVGGMYALAGPMFEGVPSHWMFYVSVEDVDDTVRRVDKLGGKAMGPPMDIPGVGRMAMLEDPTGAKLSVFKGEGEHGVAADPMMAGVFCWTELTTPDPDRALTFYSELFGWSGSSKPGPMEYTELSLAGADMPFGGLMKTPAEMAGMPPAWMGYVMSNDVDADAKKAEALGGKVFVPPSDIPDVGRFSVMADPTGAAFALFKLSPKHC